MYRLRRLLLLTGWFAVSCGWETTLLVLGAAALHELGHILCLRRFGAPIRRLRIGVLGAVLETGSTRLRPGTGGGTGGAAGQSAGGSVAGMAGISRVSQEPTRCWARSICCQFPHWTAAGRYICCLCGWGPETAEWGCRCVGLSAALAAASRTGVADVAAPAGSIWLLPAAAGTSDCGVENAAAWRNRLNLSLSLEL